MDQEAPHSEFNKAGIVLFGEVAGEKHVVAPYTEGRFGSDHKYYVLAKGGIDAGEDVLDAAIRESSEETGIDIRGLLGDDAIERLRRGETVTEVDTGRYPGVKVKQVMPNALDFIYSGREDIKHHAAMLGIELEGIEHLYDHLKNPYNRSPIGDPMKATIPVRSYMAAANGNYPSFGECLQWLRDMRMPQGQWSKVKAGEYAGTELAGTELVSPLIAEPDWFRTLEAQFMEEKGERGNIQTVKQWQRFQQWIKPEDYQRLHLVVSEMKEQLKDLGVVKDDKGIIKFDTRDCPMVFYQEGADILRADEYLRACLQSGLLRKDYARAFCGDTPQNKNGKERIARITGAQLAGVVWATGTAAIDSVANAFERKPPKTGADNQWLGGNMYDGSLRSDLHAAHDTIKDMEVPITEVLHAQHQGAVHPDQLPLSL